MPGRAGASCGLRRSDAGCSWVLCGHSERRDIFGETEVPPGADTLLLVDRGFEAMPVFREQDRYHCVLDTVMVFDGESLDAEDRFSEVFQAPFSTLTDKDHAWFVLEAQVSPADSIDLEQAHIVIHMQRHGKPYAYSASGPAHAGWRKGGNAVIRMDYLSPELRRRSDKVKAYVYYTGERSCLAISLRIKVFERKGT